MVDRRLSYVTCIFKFSFIEILIIFLILKMSVSSNLKDMASFKKVLELNGT
jgi:hypothetical protein